MTTTRIAYDIRLMKPACPVLAAGLGGDTFDLGKFPDWLLELTPDMKVYEVTPDQLRQLVEKSKTSPI